MFWAATLPPSAEQFLCIRPFQSDRCFLAIPRHQLWQGQRQTRRVQRAARCILHIKIHGPLPVEWCRALVCHSQLCANAVCTGSQLQLCYPEPIAQPLQHGIISFRILDRCRFGAEKTHVRCLQQVQRTGKLLPQHIPHGKAAGELAAHRGILPESGHGRKSLRLIAIPAALCGPSQPLHGVFFLAGHIVVKAKLMFCGDVERPSHQQLRRRKSRKIISGIFVPDRLVRHGYQPIFAFDMPLAPVSKAAQLHIGNKSIRTQKLRQRIKHTMMRSPEHCIGIVWRVAFPIIRVVPAAILCLRIKPVRNIQMRLFSRHITDKTEHQVDPLLPQ